MKDLSQEHVAKQIGISGPQVGAIEADRSNPSISVLIKLSDYYNVSLDWLMKGINVEAGELPNKGNLNLSKELSSAQKIIQDKDQQIAELSAALLNISKLVKLRVADCSAAFILPFLFSEMLVKNNENNELATKQQKFVA
jgi:transcriptional regulator with XRE-family HTH domain